MPLFNLFNLPINSSYNMTFRKCIKLIGIYKLFILQFTVAMGQEESSAQATTNCATGSTATSGDNEAYKLLSKVNCKLCSFCKVINKDDLMKHCEQYYLGIVTALVTLIISILFFHYMYIKVNKNSI
ncbi:hypothetical protein PGO_004425 [Plasmodium gonderi]|uniref:Variable surface protein n=1 Tax=Plasmodium gonderi TaxID=77519 RepID=A0A1Y1JR20_PLAGO|nr:hypothetical protein PGO_004425 [Plasmodium gonderi]GAW84690.1 hypothetical protein PGO_004425 [Plasmodium gonderi]